jgi:hypothetical protein
MAFLFKGIFLFQGKMMKATNIWWCRREYNRWGPALPRRIYLLFFIMFDFCKCVLKRRRKFRDLTYI